MAMSSNAVCRSAYAFRPVVAQDMPTLRVWLRTPEVIRWWGDPETQAALLQNDLNDPRMVMRMVAFQGQPFAYTQDYIVHAWPQPHFAHLPPKARAIDAFVGEPDMIGCGHGSAFLRLLAKLLLAEGAPVVVIDPGVTNLRACRAYEKAGFHGCAVVETGEEPVILMIFEE
jgi:aminoglycoside 6'-N-acetyltransferase